MQSITLLVEIWLFLCCILWITSWWLMYCRFYTIQLMILICGILPDIVTGGWHLLKTFVFIQSATSTKLFIIKSLKGSKGLNFIGTTIFGNNNHPANESIVKKHIFMRTLLWNKCSVSLEITSFKVSNIRGYKVRFGKKFPPFYETWGSCGDRWN